MLKFLLKEGAFIDEYCVTSGIDTDEQDDEGSRIIREGPLEKIPEINDMKFVQALKDTLRAESRNSSEFLFKVGSMHISYSSTTLS